MQTINIDEIGDAMIAILESLFQNEKAEVWVALTGYINDQKTDLMNLADGAISGDLSYAFVIRRLKEKVITIKDYLLSIGEMIAADIVAIVNKAVDIFRFALNDAIVAYS